MLQLTDRQLEQRVRRLGVASGVVLAALRGLVPLPLTQIADRVSGILTEAGLEEQEFDSSTIYRALQGLNQSGLVESAGRREVDVPGPYGSTRRAEREVFTLTREGQRALEIKERLDMASRMASDRISALGAGG